MTQILSIRFVSLGCEKQNLLSTFRRKDDKESSSDGINQIASAFLLHICRILNAFSCVLEDLNPSSTSMKGPVVNLPSPSALSPIRRKSKVNGGSVSEKEEKVEDVSRKWNKPIQLLNPTNLGFFTSNPLYMKLYELLKGTYDTCKVNCFTFSLMHFLTIMPFSLAQF